MIFTGPSILEPPGQKSKPQLMDNIGGEGMGRQPYLTPRLYTMRSCPKGHQSALGGGKKKKNSQKIVNRCSSSRAIGNDTKQLLEIG